MWFRWLVLGLVLLATSSLHQGEVEGFVVYTNALDLTVASLLNNFGQAYPAAKPTVAITSLSEEFPNIDPVYSNLQLGFVNALIEPVVFPSQWGLTPGYTQLPFLGGAMVAAYNLPSVGPNELLLDLPTLALIYTGNITMWDDPAIQQLNPSLVTSGLLPHQPILISVWDDRLFDMTTVFVTIMSNASPAFVDALNKAGGNATSLPPFVTGNGTIGYDHATQAQFVASTKYALAYLGFTYATQYGLAYARMTNRDAQNVTASASRVLAAMEALTDQIQPGVTTLDISNAPGPESWPMSYILYAAIPTSLTNPVTPCPSFYELLSILLWSQTNPVALSLTASSNFTALSLPLFRIMLNSFPVFSCNNLPSFTVAALLGLGSSYDIYPAWADLASTTSQQFTYYEDNSPTLAVSNLATGITDYAVIDDELSPSDKSLLPQDIAFIPMTAYPVVPAVGIAALITVGDLILDLETIALIYLGNITMWNDSRIVNSYNQQYAPYIPTTDICVIWNTEPSPVTKIFTTVLAKNVPEFAQAVIPGEFVNWTVVSPNLSPCSFGIAGNPFIPIDHIGLTPGSFLFWKITDVISSPNANTVYILKDSGNITFAVGSSNVALALRDYENPLQPNQTVFSFEGTGPQSWPFIQGTTLLVDTQTNGSCDNTKALLDWIWSTQTDSTAAAAADAYSMAVGSVNPFIRGQILNTLASVQCNNEAVFSLSGCVYNGTICANHGTCNNGKCQCASGYQGDQCQSNTSSSLSTGAVLGIVLGILFPIVICLLLLVPIIAVIIVIKVMRRTGLRKDDWEINPEEIELGEPLGSGGFGTVYKASWRGTEVAVKMLPETTVSKEMSTNFRDEIHVMMALRHPNVVLFMAASTRSEKMCLVMEYMALGSLWDVLHNELIPDIPFILKVKLTYQAAKGMHFLHSSGIVHRDLKSLNLLLDAKWNVKVSDFGLTNLKQDIKAGKEGTEGLGSIPWTAPEVLNDSPELDYILADVYSFGIILWEVLTRLQPYAGQSPASIAVSVIREDARPKIPDNENAPEFTPEYDELMKSCWHTDPSVRPTFLEIVTRLGSMTGDISSSSQGISSSSASSVHGSSWLSQSLRKPSSKIGSTAGSSTNSSGSWKWSMIGDTMAPARGGSGINFMGAGKVNPPMGPDLTIVFSDITSAASLWEYNAEAMKDATLMHNELLRSLLTKHRGYEVRSIKQRNTGEGSFCMIFQEVSDGLAWCAEVQQALLGLAWPADLLKHAGAAQEWTDVDDKVVFRGLRVRMGVHVGDPRVTKDATTRRIDYTGPPVHLAARITAMTHGGQVIISDAARNKLLSEGKSDSETKAKMIIDLGTFELASAKDGVCHLYEMKVEGLQGRFFGGVAPGDGLEEDGENDRKIQTMVGEELAYEDRFLTSANLCRWIIDFTEIQLGKQIGMGSYGVVYKSTWKGVDVAVKRFIKQNLDEWRLLEFRAEMAFLSELHHPNVVLFIGACVRMPNLCIVTEFVSNGSLNAILADKTTKLTWNQRMRMLKSAALGVAYLHTGVEGRCVIHRDLKSSNLLVDENWNVKIADFGFARIKEENTTMTRCGTPCWTAPEMIRGEKYTEKADVYSFGIIMWEMLTRRRPFAGRNFMGVSLDVLEGKRPQVPGDCLDSYRKMMERAWNAKADKRPSMDELVQFFTSLVGETNNTLVDAV